MIPQHGPVHELVEEALSPFDESLVVAPYRVHLSKPEMLAMAQRYDLNPGDLTALQHVMRRWSGRPGGIDCHGLYRLETANPGGHWGWYEIGGRFDGVIAGRPCDADQPPCGADERNVMAAGALAKAARTTDALPDALVTLDGSFLEQETTIAGAWSDVEVSRIEDDAWRSMVLDELLAHPDSRVVGVDLHR